MKTKGYIQLEGMEFYAFHGCMHEESVIGNKFLVDIEIETDITKPAYSDNLADALNYQEVYNIIAQEMKINSNLLEHLAQRIATKLLHTFSQIESLKLKVAKTTPPIGGCVDRVSLTLAVSRSDFQSN